MFKGLENPERAALATSVYTAVVAFIGIWLAFYFSDFTHVLIDAIVVSIIIGIINFIVARYMINVFVFKKVRLLYKTIHDIKSGNIKEEERKARQTKLTRVENEVMNWAEERKSEIEELNEREKFRREFIGNVSHELKTPIFNIQGYILSLIDGGIDDPKINVKYLERASKSVDRMINLIEDMDTLTKLESAVMEIKKRPFLVVEMIRDVMDSLEDYAAHMEVKLKFSPAKKFEPVKVLADPNRIEQVLVNLITNGVKYSEKRTTVTIDIHEFENGRLLIEVADEGVGIPEKDVPRIFERFYRVDKSRTREAGGSGLGLSIVKHIIDAHKETINAQSTVGVGSTFSFTLEKAKKAN